MKIILIVLVFINSYISYGASSSVDILTWPKMGLADFGCFLEKRFKHKHPKYNCDLKNYKNLGDPCKNYEAYYEGIEFPQKLVSKIHPNIKSIELSWEHGELQSLSLSFKRKIDPSEIQKTFALPLNKTNPRPNIINYNIQDCSKNFNCLSLEGFDHIGAGDVGCGED